VPFFFIPTTRSHQYSFLLKALTTNSPFHVLHTEFEAVGLMEVEDLVDKSIVFIDLNYVYGI